MLQATIYTARYCPHCTRAKNLLKERKITYREIDITEDQKTREEVEKRTGWMTVPMIFIGEKFIGGADDLFVLDAAGKLKA